MIQYSSSNSKDRKAKIITDTPTFYGTLRQQDVQGVIVVDMYAIFSYDALWIQALGLTFIGD